MLGLAGKSIDFERGVLLMLRQRRALPLQERLLLGDKRQHTDRLFTRRNGLPLNPNPAFQKIQILKKLENTPYSFEYGAVSWCRWPDSNRHAIAGGGF